MFQWTDPVEPAANLGRCHFVGIGGIGMSGIARVMAGRGITVSGSDAKDVPVLAQLRQLGVDAAVGFDEARLLAADTVIVGSAIKPDNPEVVAARAAGKRVIHRSQALQAVMAGRRGIAVAGTNGKTTTSSMIAAALVHTDADPSYAIGGELVASGVNGAHGAGEVFVAEACESDKSFVVYRPEVSLVTNVQADHLDFYGTEDAVHEAFREFASCLPDDGVLVVCQDDPGAASLGDFAEAAGTRVVRYGSSSECAFVVSDFEQSPKGAAAKITTEDGTSQVLQLAVPGWHNALNATGALAVLVAVGQTLEQGLAGLAAFTGTRRRFERVGVADGVVVYDDYAHNPPKVAAALSTGRQVAGAGRLLVVFQPHLYSRTRDFAQEFGVALSGADVVLVMDVYPAREEPIAGVTGQLVAEAVVPGYAKVQYEVDPDTVVRELVRQAAPGDVVLTVGAGDVTQLAPQVVAGLANRVS